MKKRLFISTLLLFSAFLSVAQTPVDYNGKLKLVGNQLSSECGNPVQLRGMSTHGPQWFGNCVTEEALDVMQNDWGATIFRVAMYVESGGYLNDPVGWRNWVDRWVDETEKRGMYCLIDWHILSDNNPMQNLEPAKEFWDYMSKKHAGKKHVLYEICNEPNGGEVTWSVIKEYAEIIIPIIRANDPETVIMVGTPTWSGTPWDVIGNELTGENGYNVMYSYHFYSGSHGDRLNQLSNTLSQIPIFITEWGTSDASGNSGFNEAVTNAHMDVFNGNNPAGIKVSWCNWSWADKDETSAALNPGACDARDYNNTSQSGTLVKYHMRNTANNFIACTPEPAINTQPQPQVAKEGESATFRVSASGESLNYQWRKNGEDIPGATSSTFTIENVSESDFATYTVVVSNSYDTIESNPVALRKWQEGPYHGAPIQLPGRVQAQDYDIGGQDVSYFDTNPGNTGGAYRNDDVDIERASDSEGNYNVGWTEEGEWLNYSVEVRAAGTYDFEFRVASAENNRSFRIELNEDVIIESVNLPNTGGWQTYETVTINDVQLPAGEHTLRIYFLTGAINLNYIDVTGEVVDCNGDINGTATIDDCGECAGGNTGVEPGFTCAEPEITQATESNIEINAGEFFTLEVSVNGPEPFTYQWFKNEVAIEGANDNTYIVEEATTDDGAVYYVVVSNENGQSRSDDFNVTVTPVDCNGDPNGTAKIDECNVCAGGNTEIEPGFTCAVPEMEEPSAAEVEINEGEPFTLEVNANGPEPINYQWYRNGEAIEGATENTYSVEEATLNDAGTYYLIATNENGETRSSEIAVNVNYVDCNGDPNGTAELDVCDVCAGGNTGIEPGESCAEPSIEGISETELELEEGEAFTLEVNANGPEPITYQWYRNGEVIEGATENTYTVNEASVNDAGTYYVIVSNSNGEIRSDNIEVTVNTYDCNGDLNGNAQEDNCGVCAGGNTGIEPGESCAEPVIENVSASETDIHEGEAFNLEVTAIGPEPLSYQWYRNDQIIEGAINNTYTVTEASEGDAGTYYVIVANENGEVRSDEITINVIPTTPTVDCNGDENGEAFIDECDVCAGGNTGIKPGESCAEPVIENVSASETEVNEGEAFTLEVTANGPEPLSYQWYRNDQIIEGAINQTYTVTEASETDAATYYVIVANDNGEVRSDDIIINVIPQTTTPTVDCNGDENGNAFIDECDVCAGGNTGIEPGESCAEPVIENVSASETEVHEGEAFTLEVTANGPEPLSYQWYRNDQIIEGATYNTYTVTEASETDAATYYVLVANNNGEIRSEDITINVIPQTTTPIVDCNGDENGDAFIDECDVCAGGNTGIEPNSSCTEPAIESFTATNRNISEGGSFTLEVVANGPGTLSYRWYFNNELIQDANESTYTVENATVENSGDYFVIASTEYGAARSSAITITVSADEATVDCNGDENGSAYIDECDVCAGGNTGIEPGSSCAEPVIESISTSEVNVDEGEPFTLEVTASGPASMTYQWYRNGIAIAGATESSYTVENSTEDDAGTYHVVVSNNDIDVTSDHIQVSVNTETPETDCNGDINGTAFIDECEICAGGNTGIEPGSFCDVENPEIVSVTTDTEVTLGEPFSFSVSAIGTGSFTYQWYRNGEPIEDATERTYSKDEASESDAGTYYVVITSSNGGETKSPEFEVTTVEPIDCHGTRGGTAYIDACGNCAGGETGVEPIDNEEECAPTSILPQEQKKLKVYPNPASTELNVEFNSSENHEIMIINNLGKLVLSISGNSVTERLNISNLPSGLYHLRYQTRDEVRHTQFIIQ